METSTGMRSELLASPQDATEPPTKQLEARDRDSCHSGGSIETLYTHPGVKIVSFTASGRSADLRRRDSISDYEEEPGSLSWSSRLERTIAVGPMTIYRSGGTVAFLNCGSAIQPLLRKSQCWCVDEIGSQFVLQIRRPQYWRIELPVPDTQDENMSQGFRDILEDVLQFEKTHCPFKRSFIVIVPETLPSIKRPWKPSPRPAVDVPEQSYPFLVSEHDGPLPAYLEMSEIGGRSFDPRESHGVPDTISRSYNNALQFVSQASIERPSLTLDRHDCQGDISLGTSTCATIEGEERQSSASRAVLDMMPQTAPSNLATGCALRISRGSLVSDKNRPISPAKASETHLGPVTSLAAPMKYFAPLTTESRADSTATDGLAQGQFHIPASWALLPPSPPMSQAGSPHPRTHHIDDAETDEAHLLCPAFQRAIASAPDPTPGNELSRVPRAEIPNHVGATFSLKTILQLCKIFFETPNIIFKLILKTTCRILQRRSQIEGKKKGEVAEETTVVRGSSRDESNVSHPDGMPKRFASTFSKSFVQNLPFFEDEQTWGLD